MNRQEMLQYLLFFGLFVVGLVIIIVVIIIYTGNTPTVFQNGQNVKLYDYNSGTYLGMCSYNGAPYLTNGFAYGDNGTVFTLGNDSKDASSAFTFYSTSTGQYLVWTSNGVYTNPSSSNANVTVNFVSGVDPTTQATIYGVNFFDGSAYAEISNITCSEGKYLVTMSGAQGSIFGYTS